MHAGIYLNGLNETATAAYKKIYADGASCEERIAITSTMLAQLSISDVSAVSCSMWMSHHGHPSSIRAIVSIASVT